MEIFSEKNLYSEKRRGVEKKKIFFAGRENPDCGAESPAGCRRWVDL